MAQRSSGVLRWLVFAALVGAVVGGLYLTWPAPPPFEVAASNEGGEPGGTYEPRLNLDTSGFQLFRENVPPWPGQTSLSQISSIWRDYSDKNMAAAASLPPAKTPTTPELVEYLIGQTLMLNCEGKPAQAYELLGQLRSRLAEQPALAQQWLYTVIHLQGVTSLRIGEDENCVMCRGESSCILPIAPSAVHTNPRGSRQAVAHFSEYLERFPDDLGVRWLLNLAHMTLGEHPDKVDARFLLEMAPREDESAGIGAFRDVGEAVGVNRFNHSGGGIMDDFDNDGWLDIVTTCFHPSQPMSMYRNNGQGRFVDVTKSARLKDQLGGLYCTQGDFNDDGFLDVFIPRGAWLVSPIRPSLLMNQGDGTFADVTSSAGLSEAANSNSSSWGDFDNDGWLDLYMCCERQPNRLYRNRGDGTFQDVAARVGATGSGKPMCKAAVWIDADNDDDADLLLNYFGGTAMLLRNEGNGTFTDVTTTLGIDGPERGFAGWAWDYDNDGWLDLFATSYDQTLEDIVRGLLHEPHQRKSNRLYRNVGGQRFEDQTREAGLDLVFATMGSNYGDFDNDGYLDMYLGTGEPRLETLVPNRMFRNRTGRSFSEITTSSRTGHLQKGHSVACGDWNRDGQIDLFIEMGGASDGDRAHNLLFQNPGHDNAWLTLKLIGRESNRSAIGARIKVVTRGAPSQTFHRHVSSGSTFGANPLEQTLGLAQSEGIERLEIHWPASGRTQVFHDLPPRQFLVVCESSDEAFPVFLPAVQPPPAPAPASGR